MFTKMLTCTVHKISKLPTACPGTRTFHNTSRVITPYTFCMHVFCTANLHQQRGYQIRAARRNNGLRRPLQNESAHNTRPTGFYRSRTGKKKIVMSHIRGEPEPSYRPSAPSVHTAVPMQYECALYVGYTIVRATNPRALYLLLRTAVNNERKSSCM